MREREDAFADKIDALVLKLGKNAVKVLKAERVVTAAGVPVAPVDLGSLGAITGMWKGFVSAELMPFLSDTYLEAASVIWQGIDEAFDDYTPDAVSDVFAEEYLASATNRLVGIGDHVWLKVREQLVTGFSLGESVTKLAARVEEAAQVSQKRANVIARTEANMAANAGSFQQVLVSGLTGTKEWLDTNDERTRCTHRAAGGQTVDILTPFTLGGGDCGEGLSYLMVPGDPTAPPSEIIQCRCSVAFDLEMADESVVTAAGEVNSGGMIALMPTADDANTLALDGFEPASELHTTLLFLGDAASWGGENRQLLKDVVEEIVEKYVTITTQTFSVNIFNPSSDDFDTAVVLGVRGSDLLVALHSAISSNIVDIFDDEVPPQHVPWVPHITLAYTDDMSVVKQAIKKLGPVTFDRVRVVFGGETTDYPLGVQDPDDPVVAAGKHQWKEGEHPRDTEGKFTKGAGVLKKFAGDIWDDVAGHKYRNNEVISSYVDDNNVEHRLVAAVDNSGQFEGVAVIEQSRDLNSPYADWSTTGTYASKAVFTHSQFADEYGITPGAASVKKAKTPPPPKKALNPDEFDQLLTEKDIEFDLTPKQKSKTDLDAVPPSSAGKKGTKTKFSNPDGEPGMLEMAADPGKSGDGYATKTDGSKGPWGKYGAAGIMLRHRGDDGVDRYLLVARGKKLSQSGKWQLPGGGIDSKETPAQAAVREIVEELGFKPEDVAKGRVHGFHELEVPDTGGWKYTSYAATVPDQLVPDLSGENAKLETGDAKWLTVDEIQALDDQGLLLGPLAGGQWKENIVDLFPPDKKTPEVPGTQPGGVDSIAAGDFSKLKKITGPKGSNEGGIFEAPDGSRWYVKKQKSAAHAQNEHDAAALYHATGINVPEVIIGKGTPGLSAGTHTATRIVPEGDAKLGNVVSSPGKVGNAEKLLAAREGFAMDALLANWDVAGLTYDNIIFDEQGKPHRIDVGGALAYRAQGTAKGGEFGTDVVEWDTLRDVKKNPQSAKLFKEMSDEELVKSVDHVEQLTPEKIRAIVKDKKLADKLIARRENLLKRAEQEGVLSSSTGDVGFHPVADLGPSPNLGIAGKTDEELKAMVSEGSYIDEEPDSLIGEYGVVTPFMTEVFDKLKIGSVGDVLYEKEESGVITRLTISTNKYITTPHIRHETSFDGGKTWQVNNVYKTPEDMATAGYFANVTLGTPSAPSAPTPLEAFNQYQAAKAVAPPKPADLTVSGVELDLSHLKQEAIWHEALLSIDAANEGDVILKGTTLDVHNNPLRIVVRKNDHGAYELHEEEFDQTTGVWIKGRTWHNEQEFNDSNLDEYDVLKGKKTVPAATPLSSATLSTSHPGPFSTTNQPHAKLWNNVGKSNYTSGEPIAGGYNPNDATYHRLVPIQKNDGTWVVQDQAEWSDGTFLVAKQYDSLHDFGQADFSYMGVGKPMTAPGPLKIATTPSAVSATLPKKVPKLTNAIIYGKHQDGDVIATFDGDLATAFGKVPPVIAARVVFKNGKVTTQVKYDHGDWFTPNPHLGKAETYQYLKDKGPWYLGEVMPASTPTSTSAITPSVSAPTSLPSMHHSLKTSILHGEYADKQVIAKYQANAGTAESRWIWRSSTGEYVKQTRSTPTSTWKTLVKTKDPQKVIENTVILPSSTGVWSKGEEPKFGVHVPSTPTVSPTSGLSLEETIQQGKYHDGDVVATYSKTTSGSKVRVIYKNGAFVKQFQQDDGVSWMDMKSYPDEDSILESMAKGSGTWTKVAEPGGGLKPPPKVAVLTPAIQASFKKIFDDQAVKWHTSADQMVDALAAVLKQHPDFTSAQVLTYMDSTTKTKTSPTPFTDKVTKYLKTHKGLMKAKSVGLPVVKPKSKLKAANSPSSPYSVGYKAPGTSVGPTKTVPTVSILDIPHGPTSHPPDAYKILPISEMDSLHAQMISTHGPWTPSQQSALKYYTNSGYAEMNGCLRYPAHCTPSIQTKIKNAQNGMRPTPKPFKVTRGAGWGAVGLSDSDIGSKTIAEKIKLLQALEGKVVQEPGFLSTSAKDTPAFSSKPIHFEIDVPAGTPAAWVKIISVHHENELLLAAGLKYRVKKVIPGGPGPTRVLMEVILP